MGSPGSPSVDMQSCPPGDRPELLRSSGVKDAETARALEQALAVIVPGMTRIEQCITSCLRAEAPQLEQVACYLLSLGGKRVRPILALLSGRLFSQGAPSEQLVHAASGIELIHMATLLHDDIIDEAPLRRNKESALIKYGMTATLLAGDFLWVRAFGLCAHLGEFVVRQTERACVELTEGEILEGNLTLDRPTGLDEYLTIVRKKTASLFSLACAVGAHLSGATDEETERCSNFGYDAGICFQMVDDILDVIADENLLGKPSGTDLRQRTPSLINILWLQSGDPQARAFFSAPSVDRDQVTKAARELAQSPVIAQAQELAREHAARALEQIRPIARSAEREGAYGHLRALVDFTLSRLA